MLSLTSSTTYTGLVASLCAIKASLAASISDAAVELIDEPVLIKPIAIVSLIELNI